MHNVLFPVVSEILQNVYLKQNEVPLFYLIKNNCKSKEKHFYTGSSWLLMLTCRKNQHFFVLNTRNSRIRDLSLQTAVVTQGLLMLQTAPCTEVPAKFPPHLHCLFSPHPASKQSSEAGNVPLPALKALFAGDVPLASLKRVPCLGASMLPCNIIVLKAHGALFGICATKKRHGPAR